MSIWTLEEIDAQIAEWKAALQAVTTGREYTVGGQTVRHHSLPEIRDQLAWLDAQRARLLAASRGRAARPFPVAVRGRITR